MFKDVFVLKKTSWHMRMMKYIWGLDHRDFSHMCPYWWLSVFNALIAFWVVGAIKEGWKLLTIIGVVLWRCICVVFEYLSIPFSWLKTGFVYLYNIYEKRMEIVRENRRLREREEMIQQQQKEEEEIEVLIASIKGKTIEEIFASVNGNITDKLEKAIKRTDFSMWLDLDWNKSVYDHTWAQKKQQERAKALALQSQSEWGQRIDEPQNKPKVKQIDWAEQERLRMIARKEYINKINNIVRPIMKTIGYVVGSFAVAAGLYGLWLALPYIWIGIVAVGTGLWWICKGIWWLLKAIYSFFPWIYNWFATVKHESWVNTGYISLAFVIFVGTFLGVFFLIKWIHDYDSSKNYRWKSKPKGDFILDSIGDAFDWTYRKVLKNMGSGLATIIVLIFGPFIYAWKKYIKSTFLIIWKVIRNAVSLLWESIKNFFKFLKKCFYFLIQMLKNQCPAIQWKD